MAILADLSQPQVSLEQQIAQLRAENDRLKRQAQSKLTLKVSDKGGLSVYGMGKWPVTLYRAQWERLLDSAVVIREFIEANAASLKVKGG